MVLESDDETKKISTLQAGNQKASIYENVTATVQFSTSESSTIYYNSDSITNIDIYTSIVYPSFNDVTIWDSQFEEQKKRGTGCPAPRRFQLTVPYSATTSNLNVPLMSL